MSIIVTRKPRKDGVQRRLRIVAFLRENPGSIRSDIARGVGYRVHRGYAPALDLHLDRLTRDGLVATEDGRRWKAAV